MSWPSEQARRALAGSPLTPPLRALVGNLELAGYSWQVDPTDSQIVGLVRPEEPREAAVLVNLLTDEINFDVDTLYQNGTRFSE